MSFVVKQLLGADDVEEVLERFEVGDREAFTRAVRSGQFREEGVPPPAVRIGRDLYGWDDRALAGWLAERGVGWEAQLIVLCDTGGPKPANAPSIEELKRAGYTMVDERENGGT